MKDGIILFWALSKNFFLIFFWNNKAIWNTLHRIVLIIISHIENIILDKNKDI